MAADSKSALRRRARQQPAVTAGESAAVVAGLARWLGSRPAGVLLYLPMPREAAIDAIVAACPGPFFVTRTPETGPLTVHPWAAPRERHRYGFEQPVAGAETADGGLIDVVLVPGLAFDLQGRRLGHGSGYYDGLLARLPGRRFVGVTLERLLVLEVPTEPHDVTMTHLATDAGVRPVG